MAEEVGLAILRVTYLASQPWPFPHSLMITVRSGEITIPSPFSVSRTLIDDGLGDWPEE